MSLPTRELDKTGVKITVIGLGCMGLVEFNGSVDEDESLKVLKRSLELGCTFLDTADIYGRNGACEILLSKVIKDCRRDEVFVCTKFGIIRNEEGKFVDRRGDREYVRQCCDNSLKRLGISQIDLYYLHRMIPKTPIEETVAAMAELVKEGKVKYIGLSECNEDQLRRAHKIHPISAVQVEYSPWCLDIETNGVMKACHELGITIVAYRPLGRGFLTGRYRTIDDFAPDKADYRRTLPRFSGENFKKNLDIVDKIQEFATKKGVTASQLCLAWVLAQSDNMIVIPGTKKIKYLEENIGAGNVKLSNEELSEIRQIINSFEITGKIW
ncbi:5715_t:CDS:2 [Funneliformis caledonium]|uniref:5715_t:CDS:1 n=1 Tax=Funneliformis caledonium TaxID=1117310 RepID=A0A9N8W2H6_9GLOM|nr:5715_t:CDS:2 [Funneliformis caledonium]